MFVLIIGGGAYRRAQDFSHPASFRRDILAVDSQDEFHLEHYNVFFVLYQNLGSEVV